MTDKPKSHPASAAVEVFLAFLRLGCTSFGGPVAHLGYFRAEFVERRRWLGDTAYADLIALCQFLPGPASSQVGLALGILRAGPLGGLAAWLGFTLPSTLLMIAAAYGIAAAGGLIGGALQGLKIVAAAVVAQAVWTMARSLCPDVTRRVLALMATCALLLAPGTTSQLLVIAAGGFAGFWLITAPAPDPGGAITVNLPRWTPPVALGLLALLLIVPPVILLTSHLPTLAATDAFTRAGALVFGGGHVILPLLEEGVVGPGWVDRETFLAGYGLAQALPGPLFTFAAYLGTVMSVGPGGWAGGVLAVLAIFVPSVLLVIAALPLWQRVRTATTARAVLAGVNAAVVGLLLAALYDPISLAAIRGPVELAFGLAAFVAIAILRLPPWLVVAVSAVLGGLLLG